MVVRPSLYELVMRIYVSFASYIRPESLPPLPLRPATGRKLLSRRRKTRSRAVELNRRRFAGLSHALSHSNRHKKIGAPSPTFLKYNHRKRSFWMDSTWFFFCCVCVAERRGHPSRSTLRTVDRYSIFFSFSLFGDYPTCFARESADLIRVFLKW